jgi:hypothetical protein
MKKSLFILAIAFMCQTQAAEVKEVCHDVVKKGKTVKECKKIKVHKKLEGTAIPEKKK